MADEAVELDEGARIEELDEPLAREQLALLALTLDRLLGAGVLGFVGSSGTSSSSSGASRSTESDGGSYGAGLALFCGRKLSR